MLIGTEARKRKEEVDVEEQESPGGVALDVGKE
jgi:hypothetical protein